MTLQWLGNTLIECIQGDIAYRPDIQAVVNAANVQPRIAGGVARALLLPPALSGAGVRAARTYPAGRRGSHEERARVVPYLLHLMPGFGIQAGAETPHLRTAQRGVYSLI